MDLSALIAALANPSAFPYAVDAVEVRQTHISVVFLAGSFVYKIKKPVNPGFLDFTTLEKRLHFCQEEVRLNHRLAPRIYLDVVPVTRSENAVHFEGAGEAIEWAVKMQRLPEAATLQKRLQREEIRVDLVQTLAERIAAFHQRAPSDDRIAASGRFDAVASSMREVFERGARHVGTTVHREVFERTSSRLEQALAQLHTLIDARSARGMPRDCHGDLHLDHIYYFPQNTPPDDLVMIDCIEFNERFRFIDPVADAAFPVMDFAFYGRRDLAKVFSESYFRAAGDDEGRRLLPLYITYRAAIRAAVEGLVQVEKEVPASEREAALKKAQAHWLLALTELDEPARKPCLVLVAGLPGSGKSRMAQSLAERANFEVIRSDVVRKQQAGLDATQAAPAEIRESLYQPESTRRTYQECLRQARHLLLEGKRVIVDATFREESQRREFLAAGIALGVPVRILVCQAAPETVRTRLEARRGDASDADWSVYLQVAAAWEPLGDENRRIAHTVITEQNVEEVVLQALDVLRREALY